MLLDPLPGFAQAKGPIMQKFVQREFCAALLAAPLCLTFVQGAVAQTYPSQNVNVVVAFAAGGIADVIARLVGQKLTERLGQTVVVENRGGAGGNIAARVVASAAADGYTLLATTSALAVNETASRNKGYATGDLRPVAIVAISPDVIAVHPSNPAKDLKQFVALNKDKSFTFGSAGVGTGPHIGAEYFFREVAKLKPVHVPFTGGAPAVTAAIGNHIDALVLTLPTVTPQIVGGALRGIGLASPTRNSAVPDVPTYGEMGWPNVYSGSWVGFFAPAKTPDAVITKLNTEINTLMREPDAVQKLKTIGFDPIVKNTAETTEYFKSEVATWARMVKAVGITID
jgi:tripartite-type tricarboxylate transporter receptor subunit TctC